MRAPKRLLALRGDDLLVERVRAGDPTAFEVLYERHVAGLLGFCRHMLGDSGEAEDAVQQTFAAAHADLLRSPREINLKPWLYTIARNRCVSVLRARRDHPDPEPEVSTDGLSEQVQQRADLREMVADINDLPQDQRAALVLSELGDLRQAEVAEVLGCEVSNVKGLVFRARAGLAERRDARAAPCEEIRAELASARRGGLRRGRLRHHLKACPGCAAYLEDVRRQRKMLAMVLPVVPSAGLKEAVLAATGLGGGGAAAGGAAAGGGLALFGSGSTAAKLAVAGALTAGVGVAGPPAVERVTQAGDDSPPAVKPAAVRPAFKPAVAAGPPAGTAAPARSRGASPPGRARRVRRRGAGTPAETAPGRSRAQTAPGQLKKNGSPGAARRVPARPAPQGSRPAAPPGQARRLVTPQRVTGKAGAPGQARAKSK